MMISFKQLISTGLFICLLFSAFQLRAQYGDRNPRTNIVFPDELTIGMGGRNIYNIKNPPAGRTAAKGDGIQDDTQAFIDAYNYIAEETDRAAGMGWEKMETENEKPPILNFFIYIPDGTYKVSKTINYEGPIRTSRYRNTPNGEGYARDRIRSVRFVGQSKENTVIRLADSTFTDKNNPQPILAYHREEIVYSWYKATNMAWNLTINAGRGNPGAIGVRWWGANINEIGNIKIMSEDRQGYVGLQMLIGPVNSYIKDVTIDGFDYGIKSEKTAQATNPTMEYLTIRNQNIAGISINETSTSVRKLESINSGTAVELLGDAAQVVLVDSKLTGNGENSTAVNIAKNGHLFARNVMTYGYKNPIVKKGIIVDQDQTIEEYDSYGLKSLRDGQVMKTMDLPVEEHPIMPWEQDMDRWAFAKDEASLKEAMSSGKSTIVITEAFEFSSVDIPASVDVILCFFNRASGEFRIAEDSDRPLFFHGCTGLTAKGYQVRPVVFNLNEFTRYINNTQQRVKVYTQTSAAVEKTDNVIAWIRNIDVEWSRLPIDVGENSIYWVLGFKNEGGKGDHSHSWYVHDGGVLEVLGGNHGTGLKSQIIRSENAHVSAIMNNSTGQMVDPVIVEEWKGKTRSFDRTAFPARRLPTNNQTGRFYSFVGYETDIVNQRIMEALGSVQKYEYRFQDPSLPAVERAKDLVSQMTLEQKISQMRHSAPAIENLGIPAYNWWNECLHGVGRAGLATVFPQAIGMASTWNTELISSIATAISDEARAKHHHFASMGKRGGYMGLTFWTPNINIFRDPRWGRGQETYGEDPYLTARIANNFIKGLQGDDPRYLKLVATAKHYAVHSGPERLRHEFDVDVSDQDLYETYLSAFKSTVQEGHVQSVMCAYNSFRGTPCCGHDRLLTRILREEWGFDGYVVSDCGAINDIYEEKDHHVVNTPEEAAALGVKSGTDLNCGNVYPYLEDAVGQGLISEEIIDQSVIRLFTARFRLGMFDEPEQVEYANIPYEVVGSKEHRELALQAARESIVLLKNENHLLPLDENIKSIAVIGPNAADHEVLLGNYNGTPASAISVLEGIKNALPNTKINYAEGSYLVEGYPNFNPIPPSALSADKEGKNPGLKVFFYRSEDPEAEAVRTGIDSMVNFNWLGKSPLTLMAADHFGAKWEGFITAPESGTYKIGLNTGASSARLYLADSLRLQTRSPNKLSMKSVEVNLVKGEKLPVRIEYFSAGTDPQVHLLWAPPGRDLSAEAMKAVENSEAVVMVMGLHPRIEGEEMRVSLPGFDGGDRTSIELPEIQEQLIRKIHATGKPVVLVLMGGSNIAINWANDHIPAILYAWYPGESGGHAVADILFGKTNPSGKLPVTFYRSTDDLPPFEDYSMEQRTYKYFTGEVLYPFGYGLSYTKFEMDELNLPKKINAGEEAEIKVNVRNTGTVAGKEVVQLYISSREKSFRVPVRTLSGFQKVHLEPGESKTITFKLEPRDYAIYNERGEMVVLPGKFDISVGGKQPGFDGEADAASSEVVTGTFKVKGKEMKL